MNVESFLVLLVLVVGTVVDEETFADVMFVIEWVVVLLVVEGEVLIVVGWVGNM